MSKEINIPEETLRELYINQNKTQEEIAKILNCDRHTISKYLKIFNIEKSYNQIRKTLKQTNIDRYGCECTLQNKKVKEKRKKTWFKKYGCESPLQNENIKNKIKETNLKKYGVKCSLQNEKVKRKSRQTCLEKYGCENASQKHLSKETLNIISNKDSLIKFIKQIPYEKRTISYVAFCFTDYTETSVRNKIKEFKIWELFNHCRSTPELEIKDYLNIFYSEYEFKSNVWGIIKSIKGYKSELDFYSDKLKTAIEFNGPRHLEEFMWKHMHIHADDYHNHKLNECEKNGIKLYFIWWYEVCDEHCHIILEKLENKLKEIFTSLL